MISFIIVLPLCLAFAAAQGPFDITPSMAQIGGEIQFDCNCNAQCGKLFACDDNATNCQVLSISRVISPKHNSQFLSASMTLEKGAKTWYQCWSTKNGVSHVENKAIQLVDFTTENGTLMPDKESDDYDSDGFPPVVETNVSLTCGAQCLGVGCNALETVLEYPDGEATSFMKNGPVYTLNNPNLADSGSYRCFAVNANGDKANVSYKEVYVNAGIFKTRSSKPKNLMEGDDATLNCGVRSFPAATVSWMIQSEGKMPVALPDKSRYTLINYEFQQKNIINGTLKIHELEFEDRAEFICEARNAVGNDSISIELRVRDKYAALWPFLGIVAEVVVLCIIIFICEKRRAKKAADAKVEHEKNGTESKHPAVNTGGEVRQRK